MSQNTKTPDVKYYYNKLTKERIRVEPVIFVTAKDAGKKFNLQKFVDTVSKKNPNSVIILDEFLSKDLSSLAQQIGFKPFMNFPSQLTWNINSQNSSVMT